MLVDRAVEILPEGVFGQAVGIGLVQVIGRPSSVPTLVTAPTLAIGLVPGKDLIDPADRTSEIARIYRTVLELVIDRFGQTAPITTEFATAGSTRIVGHSTAIGGHVIPPRYRPGTGMPVGIAIQITGAGGTPLGRRSERGFTGIGTSRWYTTMARTSCIATTMFT